MSTRPIVLDANILVRLLVGQRVSGLLARYAARIDFLAPDTSFEEACQQLRAAAHSCARSHWPARPA
jgi:hypothetical protein